MEASQPTSSQSRPVSERSQDAAGPRLLRYAVISSGGGWRVLSARAQIGRFHTRAEAMVLAVKLTRQALESGQIAELYAQDDQGDFALYPLFKV